MIVTKLSRHFVARWHQRVGGDPCLIEVNRLIEEAVKVRGSMTLYRLARGASEHRPAKYAPKKLLAEYWHRSGLIIKVDEERATAVTVVSLTRGES